jgi:SIR2-like domain
MIQWEYLVNFPDLPSLKQLHADLWQWPTSRAAVMIGAGFSCNAEPLPGVYPQFPTWRDLSLSMIEELRPFNMAEDVRPRLTTASPMRIAAEYEAAFDRGRLERFLRKHIPDAQYSPGKLHHKLLRLPWADVFTTNYDTLLERTEIDERGYQTVQSANELTSAFSPRIIKLHGSFSSPSPLIVTEEDYRTYPRKCAPLVNSVRQSLLENSFVLLGFSGDDPNFLEWTGWIRDELGGHHAPIYLVGALPLGHPERLLLERRGVKLIDLTPLWSGQGDVHSCAIDEFLEGLYDARPTRKGIWPSVTPAKSELGRDLANRRVPAEIGSSAPQPLTTDGVAGAMERWRFERENYPGWLIAAEDKRSTLWRQTRGWLWPIIEFAKGWPAIDRLLLFREFQWRFDTVMAPVFSELIEPFEKALDETLVVVNGTETTFLSCANFPDGKVPRLVVVDAWVEIAFALLRDARESYDAARWEQWKSRIDQVVGRHVKHLDRACYEAALWEIWNLERERAKSVLARWQPAPNAPLASMWKAALLSELGELGEARTLIRTALREIRRALRSQGQNISLFSLEGWCGYALGSIELSLSARTFDTSGYDGVMDEFGDRWDELRKWDCDPWPHKRYFEDALSAPVPRVPKVRERLPLYDPGEFTTTVRFSGGDVAPYLPAYACIRLYEQAGIPMHLPGVADTGVVAKACKWIQPYTGFASPAMLIRAAQLKDVTDGEMFSRVGVASMDDALAKRLYAWCLRIFRQEVLSLNSPLAIGSSKESLFKILAEALSRLAIKIDRSTLDETFLAVLGFHKNGLIRAHPVLHDCCSKWFKRLFASADDALLVQWLPDLIAAPLFDESYQPGPPHQNIWPDPMAEFPGLKAKRTITSDTRAKLREPIDWLLKRAASESGEARLRAVHRLIRVYHVNVMSDEQNIRLGELLWDGVPAGAFPSLNHLAAFGFLRLPAPANVDVHAAYKRYLFALPVTGSVQTKEGGGRVFAFGGERPSLISEVAFASKPMIKLRGEEGGTIEWTPEEGKQLYTNACELWKSDRPLFALAADDSFGLFASRRDRWTSLGQFLIRAVVPFMAGADSQEWLELRAWISEVRSGAVFPTVALPYVLLQCPTEGNAAAQEILRDLDGDAEDQVSAAAAAVRHWVHLAEIDLVPNPPGSLLTTLIERVIFRRGVAIRACLWQLAAMIVEIPTAISHAEADLLGGSLVPWYRATSFSRIDECNGQFPEGERTEVQVRLAYLASSLRVWYANARPNDPEPPGVATLQESFATDPLPEIRHAFDSWAEFISRELPQTA